MRVIRAQEARDAGTNTPETFEGQGGIRHLEDWVRQATDKLSIVNFVDGGRTHWHEHSEGQLLIVLSGVGVVAILGQDPVVIHAGDLVIADAGERHWHGSLADSELTHLAVSRGNTTWFGAVSSTCERS